MSLSTTSRLFRFGIFEADLENARLTRKGVRIRLQEQPFHILALLLDRSGQIVTREELRQELWPAGTYVDFDGSLNAALKRLRATLDDDADNPRFIETVPKRGYRFIAPVTTENNPLLVKPEISSPLLSPATDDLFSATPSSRPADTRKRHWLLAASALAMVLAVALFLVFRKRVATPPRAAVETNVDIGSLRHSIAVLGFQNASGRASDAWLSTALAEMLRTELGAGGRLRVVPGENVAQFRLTSPWSETDSLSQQTASRIGNALGGELLVLGSFATVGEPETGAVRVDFRLQDAQTGELLYEGAETGSEGQFFGLVAKIGAALRERLNLPMISESEQVGVVSSLPSNPDANRFYSLGLAKLRAADFASAKDLFLQAEKLAPRFPLTHLLLGRTWGGLGYDRKANDEIKIAYELSSGLPEDDKLQIEAAYFGSLKDSDKAISTYRTLYALHPDSVDYGEKLIVVLNAASRREEALGVIKQLRTLPLPVSQDPRIDFWQAELMSQYPAAQSLFEKAASEAASRGQTLVYARFRLEQCINRVYGDHPEGSEVLCQEAYDIFMAAGNHLYAADALRTMGDRRGAVGDMSGAREYYTRALLLLGPLGEHEKTGVVLNNMAIGYENQGQTAIAEKLFRQAADTWTECGDTLHAGAALGNLADIPMQRGQLREAEKAYEKASKQIAITDPIGISYELFSIAAIRLTEGDIPGANSYLKRSLALSQSRRDLVGIAIENATFGDVRLAEGDLVGARQYYQQALAIRQQLGDKGNVAEHQAALADVALEEGKFSQAEQALKNSLAEFQSENAEIDEIHAGTDLAHALLEQMKIPEARQTISNTLALSGKSADPALKLPAAILDARIEAAEITSRGKGKLDLAEPRHKLESALATARQLGYYGIACDARLALGEIALRENPSTARARLSELASDAHQHGFELIARKAAALESASSKGIRPIA